MSTVRTSPSTLFGGTWEQIEDRFLLAAGDTYSAGSIGGEAAHKLTVNEMPSHNHEQYTKYNSSAGDANKVMLASEQSGHEFTFQDGFLGYTGGSQPHNNMPPYLAVYMWRRTA